MGYRIEIARKFVSTKKQDAGVKMYFDAQVDTIMGDEVVPGPRVNGFRLVKGKKGNFLGFPSIVSKDGTRYPSLIPPRKMSEAILARAEQEYQKEIK